MAVPPSSPTARVRGAWLAMLLTVLASSLSAQMAVVAGNYTATPAQGQAQGGSWNYFDDDGRQLTDGIKGANDWTTDFGHGNAYEWVGWITVSPSITFDFPTPVTIASVILGLARHQGAGIYLPPSITIGSETFLLAGDAFADFTRADLTFTLAQPVTTAHLTVNLNSNPGQWVFLDEVQFVATVPEPSTTLLFAIGGALMVARLRRMRTT